MHRTMKALALIAVLGLALGSIRVSGQPASADPYEGLAKFKFGESRLPLALIEEQIRKSSRHPRHLRTPSAISAAGWRW